MAKRQDSGSSSAHENQRPNPHNEDAVPEMTDDVRGRADDELEGEEFDEEEEDEFADEEDESDEGAI